MCAIVFDKPTKKKKTICLVGTNYFRTNDFEVDQLQVFSDLLIWNNKTYRKKKKPRERCCMIAQNLLP